MNLVGDNIALQCQMVDTLRTSVSYQSGEQENGKTGFCSQTTRPRHPWLLQDKGRKGGRVRLNFPARQTSLQATPRYQTNSA